MPDVYLEPDIDWPKQHKPPNVSLQYIVMEELGGCEKWDGTCKEEIARYNGFADEKAAGKLFDPSYTGDIRLPVKTVTLFTNLATQKERESAKATSGQLNGREPALTRLPLPRDLADTIGKNIVGVFRPSGFSSQNTVVPGKDLQPEDVRQYRERLMNSIQFPFRTFPFADGFDRTIKIGILDSAVSVSSA